MIGKLLDPTRMRHIRVFKCCNWHLKGGGGGGGGGGTGEIMNFHCFATHFISISCSSEAAKGRGYKYTFSLSSLPDQFIN